ncbi:hypothetical protein BDF22DRAFT_684775 [Syncephalis plumigaleata]|nr:hypothetical protein BDF22DRAFT_684775 [Syncephalis plumigaleata]
MSTGVEPNDECLLAFQELKKNRKYKYIFLRVEEPYIVVDGTIEQGTHQDLLDRLPKDDARYVIVNHEYTKPDGVQSERILLISWVPDTLKVKTKMLYAGSKNALNNKLGSLKEVQANDLDDIQEESVLTNAK